MATVSITISEAAYRRLKKLKQEGDSFSDVVLRELPDPLDTLGEVEDHFTKHGVPSADPKLRAKLRKGR